jgi:hypothetical protein
MFVRGSGAGAEYRRNDQSFFRGIVVKNNDPLKMNRVKVFIPELSNQPYDEWIEKFQTFILKSPGINTNPKTGSEKEKVGDWEDTKVFEEICNTIPWAEPCFPVIGESGNYRFYNKDGDPISTISDCNYPEGFQTIDENPPTIQKGSFSPSYLYENKETVISDAFRSPTGNYSVNNNPYSYSYRPSNHVNKTKGLIGIPEVGSKVWVFHYQGDYNFPVYFGVNQDFRSLTLINNSDNKYVESVDYPDLFEN